MAIVLSIHVGRCNVHERNIRGLALVSEVPLMQEPSVSLADIPCLGTIGIHSLLVFAGPMIDGHTQGLHYQLAQLKDLCQSFETVG